MLVVVTYFPEKEKILSDTLAYYIFSTPLVLYAFLLLWLIGAYLKIFVFKSLKKRYVILFPIVLSLFAIVVWMFQTNSPSEKVYTIDRQYSYYVEEYNFNKILRKSSEYMYRTRHNVDGHKLFLFDEVEQKLLYSKPLWWIADRFEFAEKESRFYFEISDYYELPRPIDKEALARQEREYEIEMHKVEMDGFMISPDEKLVYGEYMTGGTDVSPDGTITHWDGNDYDPIEEINFDKTSLIFIGGSIIFKEFFPIKSVDISSLRVIHYYIDDNFSTILSPSEDKVYLMYGRGIRETIDIKGLTHITKMIFRNKEGKLFFIPDHEKYLEAFDIALDEASLQHVAYNYFTDKNGLYHYNSYSGTQKIDSNDGNVNKKVVLYDRYFTYGDSAYIFQNNPYASELRLSVNKLNIFETNYDTYIDDGESIINLYNLLNVAPEDIIQTGTPTEPVNEWNSFDHRAGRLKGKTFYYSNKETGNIFTLIKTPDNFYGVSGSSSEQKAIKLKNVMIYNIDAKKYEPIEVDKFRRVTSTFYIYKNRMYYSDSYPFETDVDLEKLHQICHNGRNTEFYTDGESLLEGYNFGDFQIEKRDGQIWYKFKEPPFRNVDWESLHIARRDIMIDKNNIYLGNSRKMWIVQIKDLGLDVKVIEVLK